MSEKQYSVDDLQKVSLDVAKEVHAALQTWESAKPLLLEGPFNDFLQTDAECSPLLSIARGGSMAAAMAMARVWDQTKSSKIKLKLFPLSLRQGDLFYSICARAGLSHEDFLQIVNKIELVTAPSNPLRVEIESLRARLKRVSRST